MKSHSPCLLRRLSVYVLNLPSAALNVYNRSSVLIASSQPLFNGPQAYRQIKIRLDSTSTLSLPLLSLPLYLSHSHSVGLSGCSCDHLIALFISDIAHRTL